MLSFEEILAEANDSIARAQKLKGKAAKAAVRVAENPEKNSLYVPTRFVYLYQVTKCHCGNEWDELEGIYEDRRHPTLGASHWVRLPGHPDNSLPHEDESRNAVVPYCKRCVNAKTQSS